MGHKKVCFTCRKAFSLYEYEAKEVNLACPECGNTTDLLNHSFRPPKRSDIKQWRLARFLVDHGFHFTHIYDPVSYVLVPYPKTMEEAIPFVEKYKRKKQGKENGHS